MKTKLHRALALILALLLALGLTACGKEDSPAVANDIINGDFEDVAS